MPLRDIGPDLLQISSDEFTARIDGGVDDRNHAAFRRR